MFFKRRVSEGQSGTGFCRVLTCGKLELVLLTETQAWRCASARLLLSSERRGRCGKTLSKALGCVQSLTVLKSSCEVFQGAKKMLYLSEGGLMQVPCCRNSDTVAEAASATGEADACTRLLCLSSAGDFVHEHLFSEVLDRVGVSFP